MRSYISGCKSSCSAFLRVRKRPATRKVISRLPLPQTEVAAQCQQWGTWLGWRLSDRYPPLRMILVWDNLAGLSLDKMVEWLFAHGIMPLYTPLGGSWLNMAESIQRVLKRRALEGTHPATPADIIAALEATARGWNRDPTPFVWGGQRAARRDRARQRRHALGGSGAQTHR